MNTARQPIGHEELMKFSGELSPADRLFIYERAQKLYSYSLTSTGICVNLLRAFKEFMITQRKVEYTILGNIFMERMPVIFHELAKYRPEMQTDDDYWWPLIDCTTRIRVFNEVIAKLKQDTPLSKDEK